MYQRASHCNCRFITMLIRFHNCWCQRHRPISTSSNTHAYAENTTCSTSALTVKKSILLKSLKWTFPISKLIVSIVLYTIGWEESTPEVVLKFHADITCDKSGLYKGRIINKKRKFYLSLSSYFLHPVNVLPVDFFLLICINCSLCSGCWFVGYINFLGRYNWVSTLKFSVRIKMKRFTVDPFNQPKWKVHLCLRPNRLGALCWGYFN